MALVEIDAAAMQEFQIFLLKAPTPLMLLRELLKGGSMAWRRFPVPRRGTGSSHTEIRRLAPPAHFPCPYRGNKIPHQSLQALG